MFWRSRFQLRKWASPRKSHSSSLPELHHILADQNISSRLFDFLFSSFRIQGHSAHLKAQFISQQKLKEEPQTPHPQSSISQRQSVFFWGGGGFSWKKDKSQLISSIMVTPTWGRDLGFFPRTGSCSSMHVEVQKRQWEMIYNVEKMVRHRDTMMSLTLSEKFKESLWWYVSSRRNVV